MAATTQTQAATTNPSSSTPIQQVYMMPIQQQGSIPRTVRPVRGVKCLSIAMIVLAGVLVLLGIAAAVIKALHSFLFNPIWTGLLFVMTTGILGLYVYKRQTNFGMNISFLVMTLVSSVASFQLTCYVFAAALGESPYYCNPSPGFHYDGSFLCADKPVRVAVDMVIVLFALAALVLCIISFCLTMYGTFNFCYSCCYTCCTNNSPPTAQYSANTGYVMMATVNGQNAQVMTPVQTMPPGPHYTGSQPLTAASPQPFTPNAPPAYMAVTSGGVPASSQNMIVSQNPQLISGATFTLTSNQGLPAGNVQSDNHPSSVDPRDMIQTNDNQEIANNSQNWQKFE